MLAFVAALETASKMKTMAMSAKSKENADDELVSFWPGRYISFADVDAFVFERFERQPWEVPGNRQHTPAAALPAPPRASRAAGALLTLLRAACTWRRAALLRRRATLCRLRALRRGCRRAATRHSPVPAAPRCFHLRHNADALSRSDTRRLARLSRDVSGLVTSWRERRGEMRQICLHSCRHYSRRVAACGRRILLKWLFLSHSLPHIQWLRLMPSVIYFIRRIIGYLRRQLLASAAYGCLCGRLNMAGGVAARDSARHCWLAVIGISGGYLLCGGVTAPRGAHGWRLSNTGCRLQSAYVGIRTAATASASAGRLAAARRLANGWPGYSLKVICVVVISMPLTSLSFDTENLSYDIG